MVVRISVGMQTETLEKRLEAQDNRYRRAITGVMRYHQGAMTASMKDKAPWIDRTGNARSGLHTGFERPDQNTWELIPAHTVSYGIYLETRFSGRYAIIKPTIDEFGPIIMDRIAQAIAEVSGGDGRSTWERGDE